MLDLSSDTAQPQRRVSQTSDSKLRRTACDRCRGQKLRCDRTLAVHEHDQCDRCARAGLQCITNPPLPTGRPRIHPEQPNSKSSRPNKRKKAPPREDDQRTKDDPEVHLPTPMPSMMSENFNFSFMVDNGFATPTSHHDITLAPDALQSATAMLDLPYMSHDSEPLNHMLPVMETNNMFHDPSAPQDFTNYHFHTTGVHQHANIPSEISSRDREQALYRLSQLNTSLFRHLSDCDVTSPENKYSFLSPTAPSLGVPMNTSKGMDFGHLSSFDYESPTEKLAIGQMLGFLQEFLGILRHFLTSMHVRSAPSLSRSSSSGSGSPYDSDSEADSDSGYGSRRQSVDSTSKYHYIPPNATIRHQSLLEIYPSRPPGAAIDYPTMLALINCYVSLVRLYRTALEKILTSSQQSHSLLLDLNGGLQSSPPSDSADSSGHGAASQSFPAVLPGLHIDGFTLTNHRTLQITVFMQVSMDLLGRVERAVAGLADLDQSSTLEPSTNIALLKMMLQHEASSFNPLKKLDSSQGDEIGLQSLRTLVKKIRRSVRDNVYLQLEEADIRPGLTGFGEMVL